MEKRNEVPSVWPESNSNLVWKHDVTGEKYKLWGELTRRYPKFSMTWTDGKYGGNVFSCKKEFFYTLDAVRGIGYKAVLAFDSEGTGFVFVKQ